MSAPAELREEEVDRLDASKDTLFAPVRGDDRRAKLPDEYFRKKPARFASKFLSTLGVIALAWAAVLMTGSWVVTVPAMIVSGLMYAHLIELQHECLHEHAFNSRRLNRICGFICGVFMLSSFWHYKHDHLRHHAFLGTPRNMEFFDYRFRNLDRWYGLGFAAAAVHPGRYWSTLKDMARAFVGRPIPGVTRELDRKKIQTEYRLMAVLVLAAVAYGVVARDPFFLWMWLIPMLLVAEPTHYLIEMPEHFGLNTQTDPNVLTNTRTIRASRFAQWFTNYNNLHTAHHYHQGVPMAQAEALHATIKDRIVPVEKSYWNFYWKVVRGEITYQGDDQTCMTR